jgi:hypothetical protein
MIKEPVNKMMAGGLWIWKEPVIGHKYIMGVDVSRGDSEDYSTFQIYDFDDREQVAEYQGKVAPDIYADMLLQTGKEYNKALLVVENNNIGYNVLEKINRKKISKSLLLEVRKS